MLQFMPSCRRKVNFYFSPNSAYFNVSIGDLNLQWKIVLTSVRAESVDIYLDTVFCSLWCFHDAATRDCLKI